MKPAELFRATGQYESRHLDLRPDDAEIDRTDRLVNLFRARVANVLDVVEDLPEEAHRELEFEHVTSPKYDGGGLELSISRRSFGFSVIAEDEFSRFAPSGAFFVRHIAVGTHDIRSRTSGDKEWGRRSPASSCDIVTILELQLNNLTDDEEESDSAYESLVNPFEGFQVLERLNWQYPVFDSDGNIMPLENNSFIFAPTINTEALVLAYEKVMNRMPIEGLIAGMNAALDDWDSISDDSTCAV